MADVTSPEVLVRRRVVEAFSDIYVPDPMVSKYGNTVNYLSKRAGTGSFSAFLKPGAVVDSEGSATLSLVCRYFRGGRSYGSLPVSVSITGATTGHYWSSARVTGLVFDGDSSVEAFDVHASDGEALLLSPEELGVILRHVSADVSVSVRDNGEVNRVRFNTDNVPCRVNGVVMAFADVGAYMKSLREELERQSAFEKMVSAGRSANVSQLLAGISTAGRERFIAYDKRSNELLFEVSQARSNYLKSVLAVESELFGSTYKRTIKPESVVLQVSEYLASLPEDVAVAEFDGSSDSARVQAYQQWLSLWRECRSYADVYSSALSARNDHRDAYPGHNSFLLVGNGHLHKSRACGSFKNPGYSLRTGKVRAGTEYSLVPELAGLTFEDAVAVFGAVLCSKCFPEAPVDYQV